MSSENLFDILVLLFFVAAFVLGYIQGAVRRLIGIAAVVFSLVASAQLSRPIGGYLAENWAQWPAGYTYMLAFGGLFALCVIVLAIITEATYERSAVLPRYPLADPLLGGLLGLVEAAILLGALVIITDSWFALPNAVLLGNEIGFIRDFYDAMNVSEVVDFYRTSVLPALFSVAGILFPAEIRAVIER